MISEIKKRDGRIEPFDKAKVFIAVMRAMNDVDERDEEVAERIASKVAQLSIEGPVDVERIQDIVEDNLMASRCKKTAKAYIKYREQRSRDRQKNSQLNKQIEVGETYEVSEERGKQIIGVNYAEEVKAKRGRKKNAVSEASN